MFSKVLCGLQIVSLLLLIGKADEIRDKIKKYGEITEEKITDDGF